jgi:hypothetical protein
LNDLESEKGRRRADGPPFSLRQWPHPTFGAAGKGKNARKSAIAMGRLTRDLSGILFDSLIKKTARKA